MSKAIIIIKAHIPPIIKLQQNIDCVKNKNPEKRQIDATIIGQPTNLKQYCIASLGGKFIARAFLYFDKKWIVASTTRPIEIRTAN